MSQAKFLFHSECSQVFADSRTINLLYLIPTSTDNPCSF